MPRGVWILFRTGWFPPVGRSDSRAFRLGSGVRESPEVAQGFRNAGAKALGGRGWGALASGRPYLHWEGGAEEEPRAALLGGAGGDLRNRWGAYLATTNRSSNSKKEESHCLLGFHSIFSKYLTGTTLLGLRMSRATQSYSCPAPWKLRPGECVLCPRPHPREGVPRDRNPGGPPAQGRPLPPQQQWQQRQQRHPLAAAHLLFAPCPKQSRLGMACCPWGRGGVRVGRGEAMQGPWTQHTVQRSFLPSHPCSEKPLPFPSSPSLSNETGKEQVSLCGSPLPPSTRGLPFRPRARARTHLEAGVLGCLWVHNTRPPLRKVTQISL